MAGTLRFAWFVLLLAPCGAQQASIKPVANPGTRSGVVNYILFYSGQTREGRREVRTMADLQSRFHHRVHFITINLDAPRQPAEQRLVRDYYQGYLPHVVVLRCDGTAAYDAAGPADARIMVKLLNKELKR